MIVREKTRSYKGSDLANETAQFAERMGKRACDRSFSLVG